jgi:hypothetical protein
VTGGSKNDGSTVPNLELSDKKPKQSGFVVLLLFFTVLNSPLYFSTMSTEQASPDKYLAVRKDIVKVFPKEDYDDGSFAPVV